MQKIFLTFFYTGLSPKAPGTVGTFASLLLAILLIQFFPASTLFLISLLVSILAIKEIDRYEANGGPHDDKSIVIDEFAGIFLAFSMTNPSPENWVIQAILSFVFFTSRTSASEEINSVYITSAPYFRHIQRNDL